MSHHAEEIFGTSNLKVTASLFEGDTLFITFQSAVAVGLHQSGFGEKFFAGRKISAVHVVPVDATWYQYGEIMQACAAIRTVAGRYSRVVTYGLSMGGYAALNFAAALGASEVLAISPQYTIDPTRSTRGRRFGPPSGKMPTFVYDQPAGREWSGIEAFILFDPRDESDLYHAELARSEAPVHLVRLPHSTHPCTQVLSRDVLKALLEDTNRQGLSASLPALVRGYRRDRGKSWIYWLNLAQRHGGINKRRALAFALEAYRLQPDNADVLYVVGMLRLSLSDFAGSLQALDEAIARERGGSAPYYFSAKAQALIGMHRLKAAALAIGQAKQLGLPAEDVKAVRRRLRDERRQIIKTLGRRLMGAAIGRFV